VKEAAMRKSLLYGLLLAAACSGDDGATRNDGGVDMLLIDAPANIPVITSFTVSPTSIQSGVPSSVTWNWTYQNEPTLPDPTCSIDNGVGAVTRGQTTQVTINAVTVFTLTCTNSAGSGSKIVVLAVPPVAPNIATFTATPSPVLPNQATSVTFSWTYSTPPSPSPTCTIDAGIGAATNNMTVSVTLPQARTYRLRCQNPQGTSTRDVTVAVNECAGGTHDCNANATCSDTTEGFTCSCNSGYTGNGDVCSAQASCGVTPALCDTNATCVGGSSCVCNSGYIGNGTTCTRAKLAFVSTATGTGNLSTWAGAGTNTGLAAADAVCASEATAAGLPGTYVAWMSDSTSDAYCRVHGLTGKKANNCGLGALPVAAGPWVRTDSARTPAAPAIDQLLAPTRQTFYPVTYRANGIDTAGSTPQQIFTGTDDAGVLTGTACTSWTSSAGTGAMGDTLGGGTAWTDLGTDPSCATSGRIRCVEVGSGPALPSRHPANAKRAFVTSVSGGAVLSTWADAGGTSGITAADQVCQARARYAGYTNAASYKAWLSYSSISASNRAFNNSGSYYRPDGIPFATRSQMTGGSTGRITAPLYQTETGAYVAGNAETGSVWTATEYDGSYYSSSYSCTSWSSTSFTTLIGRTDMADFRWVAIGSSYLSPTTSNSCAATDYRLYCIDDSL
jgi:hypothetical protein